MINNDNEKNEKYDFIKLIQKKSNKTYNTKNKILKVDIYSFKFNSLYKNKNNIIKNNINKKILIKIFLITYLIKYIKNIAKYILK